MSQSSVFPFPGLHVGNRPDWPHAARKTFCLLMQLMVKSIEIDSANANSEQQQTSLARRTRIDGRWRMGNSEKGLSSYSQHIKIEDRPKGYLPSQLWIPPVIYLILMFTLQWCGLRDKKTGDERMRDGERPGWWWLSVDSPRSVGRVVAGWTRLAGSYHMPDKLHRSHWHISESEHWLKRTQQDATQSESQTRSTQSSRQSHLNDSNLFFTK